MDRTTCPAVWPRRSSSINTCIASCEPGVLKCSEIETGKAIYSHRLEGLMTTAHSPIVDSGSAASSGLCH